MNITKKASIEVAHARDSVQHTPLHKRNLPIIIVERSFNGTCSLRDVIYSIAKSKLETNSAIN